LSVETSLDLQLLLQERLGLKANDFERRFEVRDEEGKLIIEIRKEGRKRVWVESHIRSEVAKYVREYGGAWVPSEFLWEIPKSKQDEYDIKASIPTVGYLYPILTDTYGNVIDGFHRLKVDPNWPKQKLDQITDQVQLTIARFIANSFRRGMSPKEKSELLGQIARLTGWVPKEIAEKIPLSYQTVMRYLPDDYKEKAWDREPNLNMRIKQEPVKAEYVPRLVACANCNVGVSVSEMVEHKGSLICKRCYDKAIAKEAKSEALTEPTVESATYIPSTPELASAPQEPEVAFIAEAESVEELEELSGIAFFKRLLSEKGIVCPICGETELQWKCGHEF